MLNGFRLNSVLELGKAGSAPGDGKLNFTFIAILFCGLLVLWPELCCRSISNMRVWLSHGSNSRNPSIWTTALKHSPRRSTSVRTRSTIAQNVESTSLRARSCKFGGCLQFLWVLDMQETVTPANAKLQTYRYTADSYLYTLPILHNHWKRSRSASTQHNTHRKHWR